MRYNGPERRSGEMQMNQEDRDLLIRMDQNVFNLIKTMEKHTEDDSNNFKKHSDAIDWLKRITYMGMGGMVALNVFLHLIK